MISFRKRFLKLFSVMYSEERGTTKLAQIKEQEIFVNPYVVQMDKFADSLQHLSKTFLNMEAYKGTLSREEIDEMFEKVTGNVCAGCERRGECLGEKHSVTYQMMYEILCAAEEYGAELNMELKRRLKRQCLFAPRFLRESLEEFENAKQILMWNHRLVQAREGYARQLTSFAKMIQYTTRELDAGIFQDDHLEKRIKAALKKENVKLLSVVFYMTQQGKYEVHLTVKAMKGRVVLAKDVAFLVGKCIGRTMIPRQGERLVIGVHFLVGGTQTNTTVISAALRPYQGAVAAVSGHINVHETGAIEATGHKVLPLPSEDGKIAAAQVEEMCHAHWTDGSQEHMVQPGMVYISHPTENGTLYTKKELADLHEVCRKYGMLLFLDGARLGYGLMAETNDITLADLAKYTDVFYIGGTKVGALFGEAVVITNRALKKDFRYMIKQNGGMLAKGRLLGIQFDTLFTDDLYFKISAHADELAMKLKKIFLEKGYGLRYDSYTNQQFPILPDSHIEKLKEKYLGEGIGYRKRSQILYKLGNKTGSGG